MATGTNGIATWGDLQFAFGITAPDVSDKCPTKSEIEESGLLINGNYGNNQLVRFSDISGNIRDYQLIRGLQLVIENTTITRSILILSDNSSILNKVLGATIVIQLTNSDGNTNGPTTGFMVPTDLVGSTIQKSGDPFQIPSTVVVGPNYGYFKLYSVLVNGSTPTWLENTKQPIQINY